MALFGPKMKADNTFEQIDGIEVLARRPQNKVRWYHTTRYNSPKKATEKAKLERQHFWYLNSNNCGDILLSHGADQLLGNVQQNVCMMLLEN